MRKLVLAFAVAVVPSFAVAASFGHMVGHPVGRGHSAFHVFAHHGFFHRALGHRHARIFHHHPFFVWQSQRGRSVASNKKFRSNLNMAR